MRRDDKGNGNRTHAQIVETGREEPQEGHVVFDFTGLHRPDVRDLAMILTARLGAGPDESVWVRSLPWQTARVLAALRLSHLFRHYPVPSDQMN